LGLAPSPRVRQSAVYDPVNDRMLIYGGYEVQGFHSKPSYDLWALSLHGQPTWKLLVPEGTPPLLTGSPLVFDSVHQRILFRTGGGNFDGATWALDLEPLRWEWLPTSGDST